MSRPLMLTITVQWRITDAIRDGHTLAAAARAGGVAPSTLNRWLAEGRKHRRGKFRRLLTAVETARSELREELDHFDIDVLRDRSMPISARQRAALSIRGRIFGMGQAATAMAVDVYHHHDVSVSAADGRAAEQPPRSLVGDAELTDADTDALRELLVALERARETVPDDEPRRLTGDVIDAEDTAQ